LQNTSFLNISKALNCPLQQTLRLCTNPDHLAAGRTSLFPIIHWQDQVHFSGPGSQGPPYIILSLSIPSLFLNLPFLKPEATQPQW
jgi:hypothetical protein